MNERVRVRFFGRFKDVFDVVGIQDDENLLTSTIEKEGSSVTILVPVKRQYMDTKRSMCSEGASPGLLTDNSPKTTWDHTPEIEHV